MIVRLNWLSNRSIVCSTGSWKGATVSNRLSYASQSVPNRSTVWSYNSRIGYCIQTAKMCFSTGGNRLTNVAQQVSYKNCHFGSVSTHFRSKYVSNLK